MTDSIISNPSWWKRRSSLERNLIILVILFLIAGILLGLSLAYSILWIHSNLKTNVCLTKKCIQTASEVINRMNFSVNPCDNFYEFSCGNFEQITEIPKARTSVTSLSIIEDQVQKQLKIVLEEPVLSTEPKSFAIAKKIYQACINETNIEMQGLESIKRILKQLGDWPVLEGNKWKDDYFDWKNLTHDLKKHGFIINHLISLFVGTDKKNPTKRVLQLYQGNLELPRPLLLAEINDRNLRAYLEFMIDVAVILGAERTFAETELLGALLFQKQLAEITIPATELRNASLLYNPMTIEELQIKHPTIPWLEFINNMLTPTVEITEDEIIINQVPEYITKLEYLLKKTPSRIISNYLLWQVVKYSLFGLPQIFRSSQLQFLNTAAGVTELEPRWKQCAAATNKHFDLVIASMYVRKYFDRGSKKKVEGILNNVKSVFRDRLKNVEWMDEATRKSAIEKLDNMHANIAYPDEILDDQKLDKVYEKVQIIENNYLESDLLLNQWDYNFSFSYLRKPVNKTDWIFHGYSTTIGAFYTFSENSIQIPAGILQGSFFSSGRPNYMNYGGIGFTFGHEITHGFDNQGRQYDKNGAVVDWWAPETKRAFIRKTRCIIDQYNNYTVPGINQNINGMLTEGENIADNGGIKSAYLAYKTWLTKNPNKDPQLPGLPFTPLQMFWISMASTWCTHDRPDHLKLMLYDTHSPYRFRIIGSMSNQIEFARDFNCPVNSNMNPAEKCQVW